ncbi:hypothetical protein LJ656_27640 [Paraburkholderia sp. MMS20-SJTR3]|uniref:Uncharacterized protein n=1 Tax=Paraburkholderia sejongensis TaxID=2886946 RepID=A0ABS8K391_9BURK|nr:hypothetical protein [Paraburkholderia sp. MMS20-SJTR3]MCC8396369.1 hypothetical protein [Paraburkholderia sp. MMS20-SJTR3]
MAIVCKEICRDASFSKNVSFQIFAVTVIGHPHAVQVPWFDKQGIATMRLARHSAAAADGRTGTLLVSSVHKCPRGEAERMTLHGWLYLFSYGAAKLPLTQRTAAFVNGG